MPDKIYINARYSFREDTLENWELKNPILEKGEPSIVRNPTNSSEKMKFGDGVTPWNDLPYFPSSVEVDQTYTPTSSNAQSGLATAEAVGVANDYTDKAIKSLKTYANNNFAPVIKNTVSGSVLAVHDVSPAEHDLDVSVRGKNLLNPIEIKQVYTSTTNFGIYAENPLLLPSGTYTFKYYGSDVVHQLNIVNSDTSTNIVLSYNKSVATFTLTEATHICISLYNTNGFTEYGEGYYQLELGTTATDYTPYVSDLSAVGVSRYGKNLITPQELYKGCYMYEALEYENRNCIKMTSGSTYTISPSFLKPNTQYTVSFWTKSVNFDGAKGPNVVFSFNYSDGTQYLCYSQGDTNNNHNVEWYYTSFTSAEGKTVSSIGVAAAQYQIENYIDTDTFLFEVSDKATEYTPYIEPQTVTANADGTVEGLTSLSPNITVTTDTEGVVIDMTYNADTKMYIDNKLAEISTAIVNNV